MTTTLEAFSVYAKDPVSFTAKMEEFNAAAQRAVAATEKAEAESASAALILRKANEDREDLNRRMVDFDAREARVGAQIRERALTLDAREAAVEDRARSMQSGESALQARVAAVQAREGEAASLISDAKASLQASEAERKRCDDLVAALRAAMAGAH